MVLSQPRERLEHWGAVASSTEVAAAAARLASTSVAGGAGAAADAAAMAEAQAAASARAVATVAMAVAQALFENSACPLTHLHEALTAASRGIPRPFYESYASVSALVAATS